MSLRLRSKGFEVLAFPSDDFRQEPGTNEEISAFISENYPVAAENFHIFNKVHVNGHEESPVYSLLKKHVPGDVPHNFYKYLVDRKGIPIHRFDKKQDPLTFEADILKLLES
jgi:glutathione peroxidase